MSVNSVRTISVQNTGDVAGVQTVQSSNASAPGVIQLTSLASGDNTITVPTGGSTPQAATVVFPSNNAVLVKLKGAGGDTGVKLHATAPTSIALDATQTTFILNAASAVTGVRIIWS